MNIISLDEFLIMDDERVPVAKVNEHGVYKPQFRVMAYTDKRNMISVHAVKCADGWRWSFDYMRGTEGGGSYPHPKADAAHASRAEVIEDIMDFARRKGFPIEAVRKCVGGAKAVQQSLF